MLPKHLNNNDPWMLAEDIPGSDLFFFQIPFNCFVERFGEQAGLPYQKVLAKFEGFHMWFYFGTQDSFNVGQHIVDRIVADPAYGRTINDTIIRVADALSGFARELRDVDLKALSNDELWQWYDRHYQLHYDFYTWVWIGNASDMFHTNFTNRIKAHFRSVGIPEENINTYLVTLTNTTVRTPVFEEQQELLRIVERIEADETQKQLFVEKEPSTIFGLLTDTIQEAIRAHWRKYFYTKFIFVDGVYTIEDYVRHIQEIIQTGIPAATLLADQDAHLKQAGERKAALRSQLQLGDTWNAILDVFGSFMVTKIYRRYAQLMALQSMDAVLREISRRTFLSLKQVKFMLRAEVQSALTGHDPDSKVLAERAQGCVYYTEKGYEAVYVGEKAEALAREIVHDVDENLTELHGEVGCPGHATGHVKIIIRAEEMRKMEVGDILVSIATDPDIVPAMKKAAAIVTEQGGVTSHAAIVSRELGIPCVIGTKVATRVFKDGDLVEVDANTGTVRKV